MRRIFTLILATILMGTLLAGCSDNTPKTSDEGIQTAPLHQTETDAVSGESYPDASVSVETEPESTVQELPFGLKTPDGQTEFFSNYRVTLEKVSDFEADFYARLHGDVFAKDTKRNGLSAYTILSFDGQDKLGEPVHSYVSCGNGVVITTVYTATGPARKIVNVNTGEVYLDDDTAATIGKLSDRFYYVAYITEETDNEDECFIYAIKVDDNIEMSTIFDGPAQGETMYKGYVMIFDLQEKQFVSGLRIEEQMTNVKAFKDALCVHHDAGWTFYDVNGSVLAEDLTRVWFGEDCIIRQLPEGCEIYDTDLNKLSFLEGAEHIGDTNNRCSDRYFGYKENGCVGIMKATGEKITEPVYQYAIEAYGDYIVCKSEDEKVEVIYSDGSVVVPGGVFKKAVIYDGRPAIWLDGGTKYTYCFGGTVLEDVSINDGLIAKRNTNEYFIYSTGQWMEIECINQLSNGLLHTEEGIVDVFTGSVLLPGAFKKAQANDEYLCVYEDGVWTAYAITLTK